MATPYVASITIDNVADAIGAFLQPFVGADTPVIRANQNEVAPPPGPYVELTEILQVDLETPIATSDGANLQTDITGPKRIDFQIDFYGLAAGDWCSAVKGILRTPYAPAQFPDGISPLYCSDGNQHAMITAEAQYQNRWTLTLSVQYNPIVSIPQQSATTLAVNKVEALQ